MNTKRPWLFAWLIAVPLAIAAPLERSPEYSAVQARLAQGWNTWDAHSVIAQVLLPEAVTIRLGVKHNSSLNSDAFLPDALIGRQEPGAEQVIPGPHTWTGSYSELTLVWRGHRLRVQTAHAGADLVMLVTPLPGTTTLPPSLVVSAGLLWGRDGAVAKAGDRLQVSTAGKRIEVFATGRASTFVSAPVSSPFLSFDLAVPAGVSTGQPRTLEEIRAALARARLQLSPVEDAIETVVGWDTLYEPTQDRVVTPVSRIWCMNWGGYVLFDWDTFFASSLAAVGNRDLAYANALEILRESTAAGFVPNYARAGGWRSVDRSEPPVGAISLLALYQQYGDKWILRDSFDALLRWHRWWAAHRDEGGYLVWGSDGDALPHNPDDGSVGGRQGAMYESGLDNSPLFDGAVFSEKSGRLRLADVGLISLYVADANALAEIADLLGKTAETAEVRTRAERYRASLQTLWSEETGMFLNKDLATGKLSAHLAPTNFYPLIARAASTEQARRMVQEHLLNPREFWGEWVIPAIAHSDPAFHDQEYWRGRIWGPMNFLVYLGLRNYEFPAVRAQLAEKSWRLFEGEWREKSHVHENYNAITGQGDDVSSSDRFYHWGALLALIKKSEESAVSNPR